MDFSTFAKMLFHIIGGASSTSAFVKTLFDTIVIDEGQSILDEVKTPTYKAYFNGNTGITRIAQKISAYLEPAEFDNYIHSFSDAAVQSICESFLEYIPDITCMNAGEKLSELFAQIIKEAASKKKTPPAKKGQNTTVKNTTPLEEKILASGKVVADILGNAIRRIGEDTGVDTTNGAEVEDVDETSGAATVATDKPVQVINNPAVVNQYADGSVHIDRVDTLDQRTMSIQVIRQIGGNRRPTTQTISTRYYHLFVMGGETFEQDSFIVPADRAIGTYWTSEDVRQQHAALSDESIEELKTYPALFLPESEGYYAKAGAEQYAHFGLVTDIRVQDNGIKIKTHIIWSLPLQDIANIGFNLGMKDMDKAIGELNRTHWAIKRINLIEEFKDAGISILGIT